MIQLEQQQHKEFVVGWVADTNYLYPARWGWININYNCAESISLHHYHVQCFCDGLECVCHSNIKYVNKAD